MNFSLIKELALVDFKLRYKNSVLGYLWSLLKPLAIFGSLFLVYSIFIRFDVPNYPLFLLLGVLIWNYFGEATINGMGSLVNKAGLLTKVNIDKRAVVLASAITNVLTLLLNLVVFFIFLAIIDPHISKSFFLLPIAILNIFMISLGVSFALASIFVRLRDISSIWEILLQIGFWVTPIIYPISFVPNRFLPLIHANPVFRVIEEARMILVSYQTPSLNGAILTFLVSLFVLTVGYLIYTARAATINENI